jgi:hypothetical protein
MTVSHRFVFQRSFHNNDDDKILFPIRMRRIVGFVILFGWWWLSFGSVLVPTLVVLLVHGSEHPIMASSTSSASSMQPVQQQQQQQQPFDSYYRTNDADFTVSIKPNKNQSNNSTNHHIVTTIAFGSCHKTKYYNASIWDTMVQQSDPDSFLWLGDTIYPPYRGLATVEQLEQEYHQMLYNATIGYTQFIQYMQQKTLEIIHPRRSVGKPQYLVYGMIMIMVGMIWEMICRINGNDHNCFGNF